MFQQFAILSNPIFLSVLGEIIADCPAGGSISDSDFSSDS